MLELLRIAATLGVLTLLALAGTALGLAISALSSSEDAAATAVPIAIIPQIVLADAITPLVGFAKVLGFVGATTFWGVRGIQSLLDEKMSRAAPRPVYGKHTDETIYVVGTGPSMRAFPVEFLAGKITIGLNQSWRYLVPTYMLTVHPELYLEHERLRRDDPKMATLQWIIKKKPPMAGLVTSDPTHYVFHTRRDLEVVRTRERDTLYLGEGVQTTAIDLAVRLGARHVVLVGCDMASLGGEYHGHDQHVRGLGQAPGRRNGREREVATGAAVSGRATSSIGDSCPCGPPPRPPGGVGEMHSAARRLWNGHSETAAPVATSRSRPFRRPGACPSPRKMSHRNRCIPIGKTLGRRAATADRTRRPSVAVMPWESIVIRIRVADLMPECGQSEPYKYGHGHVPNRWKGPFSASDHSFVANSM